MKKIHYLLASSCIALGALGAFAPVALAQSAVDAANTAAATAAITYPITELGSCKDKKACRTYCDDSTHMQACVAFAETRGLLSGENLRVSKLVAEKIATKQTPGGCTNQASCEAYCNGNAEHLNACLAFGEQLGVIPKADLEEARKIAKALAKGAAMPGSCKTKGECQNYCAVGAHIDECLNFAEAAGMIPADQLAEARKVAPFLKSGDTPGKCTTKATCDAYCADSTHFDECLGFAEKAGFVSGDDAAMARKTGGKGPGSCKSKDQCEAYCNEESHATECATFAKEKGLLTAEQQQMMDTGMDRLKTGLDQIPAEARPEVLTCLQNAVGGAEKLDRLLAKQDTPTKAMGDKIQACFATVSAIMQKVMTEKYGKQGAGAPGATGARSAPSREEMMKNLPSNIPPDVRAKIEQQIQEGSAGGQGASLPTGVVTPGVQRAPDIRPLPPTGDSMEAASGPSCAAFASVPSCDYVPAGQARDLCVKCKAQ